jgi:outer membrane lipoprotein carrier protein
METVIHKQGSFVFEKPKKIRIEYSSPDKKIYISNASTLWVYRPEDKEVEVYDNIKDVLSRDALVFFGDLSNLEKDYSILVHTLEEGRHQLVLTPKSKLSNFKTISLWVEPPSFLVQEAVLFSKNGNPTRYIFSNIKNNPKTRAEMFNFKKPRRVREIRL